MKLVKINDVRIGQIYKDKNRLYWINDTGCDNIMLVYNTYDSKGNLIEKRNNFDFLFFKKKNKKKLIGFLGITHEIKDNKLIEIPREEFDEDDIILCTNFYRNEYGEIVGQFTKKICYNGCIDELKKLKEVNDRIKKIGTLGVNYEFINSKLVKEDD